VEPEIKLPVMVTVVPPKAVPPKGVMEERLKEAEADPLDLVLTGGEQAVVRAPKNRRTKYVDLTKNTNVPFLSKSLIALL
jgi:hypothetical protein